MGVTVSGLYVGLNSHKNDDGSYSYSIMVATGSDAYRVYMASNFNPDLVKDFTLGCPVELYARPYVSKTGRLAWGYGSLL